MQNYKGYFVGQLVTTKIKYQSIPAGTNFFINSFVPLPIKKGCFICGQTVYGKIVKLRCSEIQEKKINLKIKKCKTNNQVSHHK